MLIDLRTHRQRLILSSAISIAAVSILTTMLLLPEMFVGTFILFRILIAMILVATAVAIAFGIALVMRSLPLALGPIVIGSIVLLTWRTQDD